MIHVVVVLTEEVTAVVYCSINDGRRRRLEWRGLANGNGRGDQLKIVVAQPLAL